MKARVAAQHTKTVKPYRVPPPIAVRLRYSGAELLDNRCFDGTRTVKIDGRTVEYRGDNLLEVLSRCAVQPYSRQVMSDIR